MGKSHQEERAGSVEAEQAGRGGCSLEPSQGPIPSAQWGRAAAPRSRPSCYSLFIKMLRCQLTLFAQYLFRQP